MTYVSDEGMATVGAVAVEQKQIGRAEQEIEKEIAALSERVQALENSLERVLLPPSPETKETADQKEQMLCGLAASMLQDKRDIMRITERVRDIQRRLQV